MPAPTELLSLESIPGEGEPARQKALGIAQHFGPDFLELVTQATALPSCSLRVPRLAIASPRSSVRCCADREVGGVVVARRTTLGELAHLVDLDLVADPQDLQVVRALL